MFIVRLQTQEMLIIFILEFLFTKYSKIINMKWRVDEVIKKMKRQRQ